MPQSRLLSGHGIGFIFVLCADFTFFKPNLFIFLFALHRLRVAASAERGKGISSNTGQRPIDLWHNIILLSPFQG